MVESTKADPGVKPESESIEDKPVAQHTFPGLADVVATIYDIPKLFQKITEQVESLRILRHMNALQRGWLETNARRISNLNVEIVALEKYAKATDIRLRERDMLIKQYREDFDPDCQTCGGGGGVKLLRPIAECGQDEALARCIVKLSKLEAEVDRLRNGLEALCRSLADELEEHGTEGLCALLRPIRPISLKTILVQLQHLLLVAKAEGKKVNRG